MTSNCECSSKWLNHLHTDNDTSLLRYYLLCNYDGLQTVPTNKLCRKHSAKVAKIFLKSNHISMIPEQLHLSYCRLQELYLPANRLSSLPDSLEEMKYLERINLDSNLFKCFPKVLFRIPTLQVVVLRNNCIKSIPNGVSAMVSVQHLDLSFNRVSSVAKSIGKCKLLLKLWVNHNCLCQLPRQLCELELLEELNISSNNIVTLPIDLGKSSNFKLICLDNNKMLTAVPHHLKGKINRYSCSQRRIALTVDIANRYDLVLHIFDTQQHQRFSTLLVEEAHRVDTPVPVTLKDSAAISLYRHKDRIKRWLQSSCIPQEVDDRLVSPLGHCYRCNMPLYWSTFVHYTESLSFGVEVLHTLAYFCSVSCATALG